MAESPEDDKSPLLQLPEECLMQILLRCAGHPAGAACACSRLHKLICLLPSIRALFKMQRPGLGSPADWFGRLHTQTKVGQQRLESLLLYLDRHVGHISTLSVVVQRGFLWRVGPLRELPAKLHLTHLVLDSVEVQLGPGNGRSNVVQAGLGVSLKHLELNNCMLLDGAAGLVSALAALSNLQHLSAWRLMPASTAPLRLPSFIQPWDVTRMESIAVRRRGLAPLAGKAHLKHLELWPCFLLGHEDWLLAELQHLSQLTRLCLSNVDNHPSCHPHLRMCPAAAAYSALTASSVLEKLHITGFKAQPGVWQHILPAGRQLPHLKALNVSITDTAGAPQQLEPADLVAACPGLQQLSLWGPYYTEQLRALTRLTGLWQLRVELVAGEEDEAEVLAQLTALQSLELDYSGNLAGGLRSLTQLTQLTRLEVTSLDTGAGHSFRATVSGPCDAA
jgi:hypothetical protein